MMYAAGSLDTGDRLHPEHRVPQRHAPVEPQPVDRQAAKLQSLMTIAGALGTLRRFEDLLELAAEQALHALGAASLSISRWERESNMLHTLINVGDLGPGEERFPADETYPLADYPLVSDALLHGHPYTRTAGDPVLPNERDMCAVLGKASEAGVPIMLEGVMWGELWVTTAIGEPLFTGVDIEFMQAVASQVSAGLAHAEYLDSLQRLAFCDPLTGLANRRGFEERLEAALTSHERSGTCLTMLACDVDGLKGVNDTLGHDAGDGALMAVGTALRLAVAGVPGAFVARTGGDEYWVLLEGRGAEVARLVAYSALSALPNETDTGISLSCGIASTSLTTEASRLMRAADAAMYAAKCSGPGQVRIAGDDDGDSGPEAGPAARRRRRDRPALDLLGLTSSLLAQLESGSAPPAPEQRLRLVVQAFAEALQVGRWDIAPPSPALRALPPVRRLLASNSGAVYTASADPLGAVVLSELGCQSALLTAEGGWLVRLCADGPASQFSEALPVLRLLVREALAGQR